MAEKPPLDALRQPVNEEHHVVRLDRAPESRRLTPDAPAHALKLRSEPPLAIPGPQMLDDAVAVGDVVGAIRETHRATVAHEDANGAVGMFRGVVVRRRQVQRVDVRRHARPPRPVPRPAADVENPRTSDRRRFGRQPERLAKQPEATCAPELEDGSVDGVDGQGDGVEKGLAVSG